MHLFLYQSPLNPEARPEQIILCSMRIMNFSCCWPRSCICVNIENNTYEVLEDGIKNANFTASENGDYAAWLVTQGDDKGCIHEIQMDTKEIRTIEHAKGERLRVVGYMNQDLIYGILQKSDILTDSDGHTKEGTIHSASRISREI